MQCISLRPGLQQPAFVGATIDWWRDNDPVYGKKFGQGGALTIDLTSESLRAVAAGLAPGWLRIGGTPADGIVYEVAGGECANVSVSPEPQCSQVAVGDTVVLMNPSLNPNADPYGS
eukprot:SAG22_NODE_613_length_8567_cov_4.215163_3_plen_117_part_00